MRPVVARQYFEFLGQKRNAGRAQARSLRATVKRKFADGHVAGVGGAWTQWANYLRVLRENKNGTPFGPAFDRLLGFWNATSSHWTLRRHHRLRRPPSRPICPFFSAQ